MIGAPAKQPGTWRRMSINSKKSHQDTFHSPAKGWVMPAPSSTNPEERQFVIDSGASMHMPSKKDWSSGELDTLKRSRAHMTAVTANGEVQTNEEAQMYVHDLHVVVTVQLLGDTPAVMSLGNLCREHGCTHEWPSSCEPRLTQNGKQTFCKSETFVLWVVPGLSSSPTTTSSSTPPPRDLSILLEPSNTRSNEGVTGNCSEEVAGNCSEGIPEWLYNFTENLEIAEIPAETSHNSERERPI